MPDDKTVWIENYYSDGSIRERTPFVNGKRNGLYVLYHEFSRNVIDYTIPYVNDKKEGRMFSFNSDGDMISFSNFKNDKAEGFSVEISSWGEHTYIYINKYKGGLLHGTMASYRCIELIMLSKDIDSRRHGISYDKEAHRGKVFHYHIHGVEKTEEEYKKHKLIESLSGIES